MKKILALLVFSLSAACVMQAQDFSMMQKYRTAKVRASIIDSKTDEPVPFASVYLIPQNDTLITNFTISNIEGTAILEDVVQGKFELNVELIGYEPVRKPIEVKLGDWDNEQNIGRILLKESAEFLDAASITAAGNPVIVKKDTITYNAAAYQTAENGMLADLLKKMPGIQIGSDGSIKVNGETVDKITIGGKTFFQKDPALAVKTLPAKIVDKIQVIDKAKDDAAFTGVSSKEDQEKVMDVQLKEEYQKGWFGNVKASGGATANGKQREDVSRNKFLFNSNAMASYFDPTDQIVLLASGKNATEPGSWDEDDEFSFEVYGEENDIMSGKRGLNTDAQAGVNYNTSRINGFEASLSTSYNFKQKDVRDDSRMISYMPESEDITTTGLYSGKGLDHKLNLSAEFKNTDKDKYHFAFRPYFLYALQDRTVDESSKTMTGSTTDNTSTSSSMTHSNDFSTYLELEAGLKRLGKDRRTLMLEAEFMADNVLGNSLEQSSTVYTGYDESRNISYRDRSFLLMPVLELTYVEPIGKNWAFQARVAGMYNFSRMNKDARNAEDGSINDFYTSYSRNDDMTIRQRFLMQYKKNDNSLLFGFQLNEEENITRSRQNGVDSYIGKGDWIFNWAPYIEFMTKNDNTMLRINYRGDSSTPSGLKIIPALNLSNPIQISTGNVYLRPSFTHRGMIGMRYSNPKHYSMTQIYMNASLTTNPIVDASWFDTDGVRYAMPVNAGKPSGNIGTWMSFNQPFGKKKNFTLSIDGDVNYSHSKSFQAVDRLAPVDKTSFNYADFMSGIWGDDKSGHSFYSGDSGFKPSNTNIVNWSIYPSLAYKLDNFSLTLRNYVTNSIVKYSLDKSANLNTWDFFVGAEALYSTPHNWYLNTDIGYSFYKGYSEGFGKPELIWNAGIAKEIKAVTLSLKAADLLGQQRSLSRTAVSGYSKDVNRLVLGRYILFGISFNFGKMNATQSQQVQRAMWDMAN